MPSAGIVAIFFLSKGDNSLYKYLPTPEFYDPMKYWNLQLATKVPGSFKVKMWINLKDYIIVISKITFIAKDLAVKKAS